MVGAVKVYGTNLIYSRVTDLHASDRPVDIADLLAHELPPVPLALFTDSGELRTASAKSVLKTNTAQLLSARRARENVDVIVIDGSAYKHHGQHLAQYNITLRSSNIAYARCIPCI